MKPLPLCLVCLLAVLGPLGCQIDEPVREPSRYTIEDFLGTTNYTGASFSPDQTKILVSADSTGIFNAFVVPVAGGEPTQLTNSTTDSIFARSFFPADERILYSADQAGNELNHLFVRETDGTVTDLTPGENLKAVFVGWSGDDRSFYVTTNERDPRFFDLYRVTVDDYQRTLIYQNDEAYDIVDVSKDGRHVALRKFRTTADSDIFVHDLEAGGTRHVTPHQGDVANSPQEFHPDGESLYFLSDDGAEYAYLVRYDLESGERETVARPAWDVLYGSFSRNGTYLVVGINNDGSTEIRVFETATMTPVPLPEMPRADIRSVTISRDESMMAFYVSDSRHPSDVFIHEIGSAEAPRELTRSLSPAIAAEDLVEAEVVRFASYDGVEIPGILYKPHQASAERKAPAVVWVHGGPGGQSRVGYSALLQYLVNHGYVVYAINNRGSSGYGKTFFKMDDRQHGEADLGDCVASKQMLTDTGYVDPERIGIVGGSYGGYMVLAALAFEPEAFTVGVDIFGVANWPRTLSSIPPYWESFREALYTEMGHPEEDAERLHRISPVFHAGNITRPLLVLQGANDPRVLQHESDDMVAAARANGAVVEYEIFPDEGHGFLKKENRLLGYEKILDFLERHLKGEGEAPAEAEPEAA